MIIDEVRLENFISHEDSDIAFESGINIIVGHNGAGKSSIIDAIRFVLFSEKRGNKMEELVKKGKHNASVQMKFRVDSNEYEIFRGMTLGKHGNINRNSWLKKDGLIVAETYDAVSNAVKDIIKVSRDLFLNSIFVKQGEMDSLISEESAKRKELFSKIIGIDILSKNAERLREIINSIAIDSKKFELSSQYLKEAEGKIEEASSSKEGIRKELVFFEQKSSELKKNEGEAYSAVMQTNEKATKFRSLTEERRKKNSEIENLEKRVKEIGEKTSQTTHLDEEKRKIEEEPLFRFQDEINEYLLLDTRSESLAAEISTLKNQIEAHDNDEKQMNVLRPVFDRFTAMKKSIDALEQQNRENERTREEYEHFSSSREEFRSRLSAMQSENEKLRPFAVKVLGSETIDESTLSGMLRNNRNELSEIRSRIESIKTEAGHINKMREELRKNRAMLEGQNKCPVCGNPLTEEHSREIQREYDEKDAEFIRNIESIGSTKKELQARETEISDRIRSLENPEVMNYIRVKEKMSEERRRISETEDNLTKLKDHYDRFVKNRDEIETLKKASVEMENQAREFSALSINVSRIDISSLRKRFTEQESEYSGVREKMQGLHQKIGIVPDRGSSSKIQELNSRYRELRAAYEVSLKMETEREQAINYISQIRSDVEKISAEIITLSNSEKEYEAAKEKYEKIRGEALEMDRTVTTKQANMKNINERITDLNNQISRLTNEVKKYEALERTISILRKIRSAFDKDGIQSLIRKDSSVFITNKTRDYLNSFNLNFDDVEIDENFDIKVTQDDAVQSIDSLSGGEKTALAIAVRLSIASYLLSKVSTMIMDEPTSFLDEDRRNNLKDIIQYSLKNENIIPQVIMITHHNELTSVADIAYEVTKRNGKSIVRPLT